MIESYFKWTGGTSSTKDTCIEAWGDGVRIGAEQWDDFNIVNGDGWNSTWKTELYFTWSKSPSFTYDICSPIWGDTHWLRTEQRDDGHNINGDGWSSTCSIESRFTWTGGSPTTKDTKDEDKYTGIWNGNVKGKGEINYKDGTK